MVYLFSNTKNPWFNIAVEEYLLKNFSEDIFYLYINSPAVIVGKHQNALAEINQDFMHENNIKLVRRISGGGTVYHDEGNLNFCFIKNFPDTKDISFKTFTNLIVNALEAMGIEAIDAERNDIIIEQNKVSGNAMHVFKNRVLEHGTLLYSSNLNNLRKALKDNTDVYQGKAVKSVRSSVANISNYTKHNVDINGFANSIIRHITNQATNFKQYTFTQNDISEINKLVEEKYSRWEWNYGYSPKYIFKKKFDYNRKTISVNIKVEKGIMNDLNIMLGDNRMRDIEIALIGVYHNKESIFASINRQKDQILPEGINVENFIDFLF